MSDKSDVIIKELTKDYGDGVLISGNIVKDRKNRIVGVSPAINVALGGGIPEGSWVTLAGLPKTGKTSTALQTARNFQKLDTTREVYYLSVEGRLKARDLQSIDGLDLSRFFVIESTESKILSAQDFLNIGEKIINTHPNCMLIIDSFSALVHSKEQDEGVGTSTRGGNAMLLAQFCRQLGTTVPVMRSIVIGITHLMANTSGYGSPWMEKGGNAIQYQVDVKLKAKKKEYWEVGDKTIGQKITWLIETSALNVAPNQEAVSCLRYGYGLDEVFEVMQMAIDLGLIIKKGAGWYTFEDGTKVQGENGLYDFLKDHPELFGAINDKVLSMLIL